MQVLPEPLRPLASYAQFIVWEPVWSAVKNKYEKYPVCPFTGIKIDHLNPVSWMTFETARAFCTDNRGVGFVLAASDPFFCVDIDNALLPSGEWSPFALELCQAFSGGAIEISYSGKGIHIFGVGQWPADHRCRRDDVGLEFYTEGRFMALTGSGAIGNAANDCSWGVQYLINKYLPPRSLMNPLGWTAAPVAEWDGPDNDAELIEKMLKSKKSAAATFGTRASLQELWTGDVDALAKAYPSSTGADFDHSSADAALCQHLAFWAGKNCERVKRLFEQSALIRDKWFIRQDYMQDTIEGAVGWCKDVYKMRRKVENPEPAPYASSNEEIPAGVIRDGYQYLGLPQQLDFFKDCVYVVRQHAIKIPNGTLLKSEQFRVAYGGYWFALDSIGDKSVKNAWEAFTESQGLRFPRADSLCFRPEVPVSGIVQEDGLTRVNVYVPTHVPRTVGDPSPFLNHLAKLLPEQQDRDILLAYMATCVQHIGVKLRWAPFIQGMPGNGKSTISKVVARAVGMRYSHSPAAKGLADDFNEWIENKLFIYIEDVYTSNRTEVIEILKPLVTESWVEIHPKGFQKYMADNRANFILNSNHKDGLRKTLEDRRYAVFFTAQQFKGDLERDGMTAKYLRGLDMWLKDGGFAIMAEYLHTYPVPEELDPRHMSEAPWTSSTNEALGLGLGGVEQEIMEAIGQCRPGFCGGWISSVALDRLLENRKDTRRIPPNRRPDMLRALGYAHHPYLPDGRTTAPVAVDGGARPRLYLRAGHLACNITAPPQIIDAYVKAQEVGGVLDKAQEVGGVLDKAQEVFGRG